MSLLINKQRRFTNSEPELITIPNQRQGPTKYILRNLRFLLSLKKYLLITCLLIAFKTKWALITQFWRLKVIVFYGLHLVTVYCINTDVPHSFAVVDGSSYVSIDKDNTPSIHWYTQLPLVTPENFFTRFCKPNALFGFPLWRKFQICVPSVGWNGKDKVKVSFWKRDVNYKQFLLYDNKK
jgi:hypothetical protein